MANTTFGNLKKNLLRRCGNSYNANDSVKLELAGGIINDVLSMIQSLIKGHPYTLDTGNTVNTVASQAYIPLVDTDIVEILQVSQRTTNSKLRYIPYSDYIKLVPNPTLLGGIPELFWTATQAVNITGQNIWTLYFIPTPSSVVAIYYDYEKKLAFSFDGTAADGEFSPLPVTYDAWIYAEAKPFIYEMLDPKNSALITRAAKLALEARALFKNMILSPADGFNQVGSRRDDVPFMYKRVATTPAP